MSREYIASVLKRLRQQSGLTADEVGRRIGKSGKTVNGWENGRSQPDADNLLALCDIYKVKNIMAEFSEIKNDLIIEDFVVTPREKELIIAYRKQPHMQEAVDKLLGITAEIEQKEKRA